MKKDSLGKHYDRFTPDERFRLAIEALVREDEAEVNRLRDTCPREIYRMTELAYRERITRSMEMTMGVCLDLVPLLEQLKMIEAFRNTLPLTYNCCQDEAILAYFDGRELGSRRAWAAAGKAGDLPGWEGGDEEEEDRAIEDDLNRISGRLEKVSGSFVGALRELERSIAGAALTIWEAFASFCNEELVTEAETVVKVWFEPMLPEIEKLKNLPDQPEVDPDVRKEYEATLKRGWSELTRSD